MFNLNYYQLDLQNRVNENLFKFKPLAAELKLKGYVNFPINTNTTLFYMGGGGNVVEGSQQYL